MRGGWSVVQRMTWVRGDTPACVDSGVVLPHVEFVGPDSKTYEAVLVK